MRSNRGWQAFLALSVLLWTSLLARAERLPIKIYTTADGLAHNTVYKIVRDSHGFLWFCTFEGLSRFDGYSFATYGVAQGLPGQVVKDLLETHDGQYWVATDAGLARFNPNGVPRRGATTAVQGADPPSMFVVYVPGQDRASKVVTSLLQDRAGTIWVGTFGGLYRLDPHDRQVALRHVPQIAGVTAMLADRRGALWLGSVNGLYRVLSDERVEHYSERHGLPSNYVSALLEDRDGRVWASTRYGGLCRVVADPDPAGSVVGRVYSSNDGLPGDWINALLQASDRSLWAASNQALIRFIPTADGHEFRFRAYAGPQGLPSDGVNSLVEDPSRNLWLGTDAGVAKLTRSGITAFTEADGFRWATAIFKDRAGDLYVIGGPASTALINRYDGQRFNPIRPSLAGLAGRANQFSRANLSAMEDRAGEWWLTTDRGLYRFPRVSVEHLARTPPKGIYTTRDGLTSNEIWRVFEDSRGDIWIGTARGGLSRWNRATEAFRHFHEDDGWPGRYSAVSFAEDRTGAVWIGLSIGGGLVRYREGRFTWLGGADILAAGAIMNLYVDSAAKLWGAISPGGAFRIDHPEAEHPAVAAYTTSEGLAGNDSEAVIEDRQGRIYLASARGIDRLNPTTGRIRHYTANEGALLGGVGAAVQDRDGALWFPYTTGLVRLVPEPDVPVVPPRVLITGVRIAGDAQPISALGEARVTAIQLPANRNQMQIDFVAPGFSPGDGSRYDYKLEGANELWSALGEQRTINFARLAPGRYRLLVRAVTADGVLSDEPASFAFTILPPVWQRWWFMTLAAISVFLVAYAVYRYRILPLIELERVRTRIAADLHDDIGSSLSQISVLSEVLRTQLGASEGPISSNISLINRVSHEALDSMSDIVWAINPKQDRLSDLVRRMRRNASELLPARGIEFAFHAPVVGHDLQLGADTRRQLFLMFKEMINNIVRHSGCARAEVTLKVDGQWIALVTHDDGRGFDPDQASDGNGLVSLRRRARSLGGETVVTSRRGQGTTVAIRIPLGRRWRLRNGFPEPTVGGTTVG
jgi:ligand-binding sensor domain-containing protein/two-component sensor histidine kinase